jgi:hypothetical protein
MNRQALIVVFYKALLKLPRQCLKDTFLVQPLTYIKLRRTKKQRALQSRKNTHFKRDNRANTSLANQKGRVSPVFSTLLRKFSQSK